MRFCVKVVCAPQKLGLISYIKMEKQKILKIRFDIENLWGARGLKTDRYCCKSLPDFAWKDMQWTPLFLEGGFIRQKTIIQN